jgi:hypothetical protein
MSNRTVELWIGGEQVGTGMYLPSMRQFISPVKITTEQQFELRENGTSLGTFELNPNSVVISLAVTGTNSYMILSVAEEEDG